MSISKRYRVAFQAKRDKVGTALWSHARVIVVVGDPPPPHGPQTPDPDPSLTLA